MNPEQVIARALAATNNAGSTDNWRMWTRHAAAVIAALDAADIVLAPKEPTTQMHSAGNMAQHDVDQTDAREIYRAMLEARPTGEKP
jgi:hypothetical protein